MAKKLGRKSKNVDSKKPPNSIDPKLSEEYQSLIKKPTTAKKDPKTQYLNSKHKNSHCTSKLSKSGVTHNLKFICDQMDDCQKVTNWLDDLDHFMKFKSTTEADFELENSITNPK